MENLSRAGTMLFSLNGQQFYPIRIPKAADSDPHFDDYSLTWSFAQYAEAIGHNWLGLGRQEIALGWFRLR